jgi:hypothetical protein
LEIGFVRVERRDSDGSNADSYCATPFVAQ